ncbi:hypothetical protein Godav_028309 [Gossypium davidsonii]|uniref:DC1 domain-containing protein n=1 Tax=Gossypium davidsonii TaxID=34287 RepID=A0A7J8S0F0_GOSDV|nr:hypothetical protein [Gossypium davidsonii]
MFVFGVKNIYCHQKCAMVVQNVRSISISDKCDVCSENRDYSSPVYVCEMCSFSLDFHCAKLSPSLKLDCHHHLLTFFKYFSKEGEEGQDSYCKAHVAFIAVCNAILVSI